LDESRNEMSTKLMCPRKRVKITKNHNHTNENKLNDILENEIKILAIKILSAFVIYLLCFVQVHY